MLNFKNSLKLDVAAIIALFIMAGWSLADKSYWFAFFLALGAILKTIYVFCSWGKKG